MSADRELFLDELIGALLAALVKGEAHAARASLAFIETVGFTKGDPGSGSLGSLRTVSFRYLRRPPHGEPLLLELEVPLLSLVPLPIFALRETVLELDAELVALKPPQAEAPAERVAGLLKGPLPELVVRLAASPPPGPLAGRRVPIHARMTVVPSAFPSGIEKILSTINSATVREGSAEPAATPPE